ncbi:MAG: DUF4838 domain-containing protein [Saprospiraceae bacterium]
MLILNWTRTTATLFSTLLVISIGHAQLTLVDNGTSSSRIILLNNHPEERTAALLLQDFVEKISGAELPIYPTNESIRRGDILINNADGSASLTEDGFHLACSDHGITISSAGGKGVIYGAVTLLEQYLGVDYFGEFEYNYPKQKTITLPNVDQIDNPAFRYRQSQNYALSADTVYRLWNRLEMPTEVFAAGYWVHTFDRLLPSDQYGKTHPEYYAYFDGKRHPGKASQWCLTNEDLFEIVARRIDSIFQANPGKNIISVSQNDGNFTNCTCEKCKAIDDYEGALSGSIITFLNKLAARFPDKEFSTLAYLYSMHPPRHIKPLPNVNIMLCDIDCNREVSLTENASGRDFMKAMEGWSAISDNIFIWDYGINFDNYVSPFPNFHILQDNIRLFKKNHATMHFSQIASSRGGDFAELRSYLVNRLMWNPELNLDSLMQHFLNGYYGAAGPSIYQYIKVMEGSLLGSGIRLWIYDSPVSHKSGMLKPELMRRYNRLFDEAEASVAQNPTYLKRVQRSRLPLQYAELEIARTETAVDFEDINRKLDLFEARVKEFQVPTLNERHNDPVDYCQLYRTRYLPAANKSIALGAGVAYEPLPGKKYQEISKTALTDGLFGGSTFVESWVGWEGQDATIVVDLGKVQSVHSIETDFLHQLGAWILLPDQVTYSYSSDGKSYTAWETHTIPEDRSPQVKFVGIKTEIPVQARYLKIDVIATKECPTWHYGVGHPSWFFVDEVTVR